MQPKREREGNVVAPNLPEDATPFERFETLTKRLLAVPKEEIDRTMTEEKAKERKEKPRSERS